jgi:glycerophosphoryl diester phosphodiesterase
VKRPLLLGHRGCRGCGFTENSLAAFEYALSEGCDGLEFDVRQTRDGHSVIWHDPDYNGVEIAGADHARLGDRGGRRLTMFEEVVAEFGHRAYLDIELKVAGCEQSVISGLKANPPQKGFMITSFYPDILLALHSLDSSLPLGFLAESSEAMSAWRDFPIRVFLPRYDLIDAGLVEDVHSEGRQIWAWTVNSRRHMRRLAEWGTDGLISDNPRLLYQTFHNG